MVKPADLTNLGGLSPSLVEAYLREHGWEPGEVWMRDKIVGRNTRPEGGE